MSFKRETRYLVLKLTDLEKLPEDSLSELNYWLEANLSKLPIRECVVVESDWPEYNIVWAMIKERS